MENDILNNNIKILHELDLDSSYITNVKFQKFYKSFHKRYKRTYIKKLQKAELFLPIIKNILIKNNIPETFLYLAMAESNFELKARSPKKAMGIWQFIPSTAAIYDLKIDYYTDERMDVEKSSKAAIAYLTRLHKLFDKWYLAALAYNCGEARVIEGITRATLDMYCEDNNCKKDKTIRSYRKTIKDYQERKIKFYKLYKVYKKIKKWKYKPDINELLITQKNLRRQYLPQESRDYIKKIISLAMMANEIELNKEEHSHLLNTGISTSLTKVYVKGGILLKNIADVIGLSKKEMQSLNPHIIKNIIPPEEKKYGIYIPYSLLSKFNKNIKNIKANVFEIHIVKKGDNLGKIARIYGTRYKNIKKYNNLKTNNLRIGQNLIIPIDPDTYKRPKNYYVKSGDSLIRIARKFSVPLKRIMKVNKLKSSMIHIGDKLVITFK